MADTFRDVWTRARLREEVWRRVRVCGAREAAFAAGRSTVFVCGWFLCVTQAQRVRNKGIRWMPWHQEAKKDVARCEKPWGAASRR